MCALGFEVNKVNDYKGDSKTSGVFQLHICLMLKLRKHCQMHDGQWTHLDFINNQHHYHQQHQPQRNIHSHHSSFNNFRDGVSGQAGNDRPWLRKQKNYKTCVSPDMSGQVGGAWEGLPTEPASVAAPWR